MARVKTKRGKREGNLAAGYIKIIHSGMLGILHKWSILSTGAHAVSM